MVNWALAVCGAVNKTLGKGTSQLGIPIPNLDLVTNIFEDWVDSRISQTIGKQVPPASNVGGGGGGLNGGGGIQPIFQVNMPGLPQSSIDQIIP